MEDYDKYWRLTREDSFPPKTKTLLSIVKDYPEGKIIVKELLALTKDAIRDLHILKESIEERSKGFSKQKDRETFIEFWCGWYIDKPLEELLKKQLRLKALYGLYFSPKKTSKGRVTPEEIERAKAYPVNLLIEFDRQGKTICPFHNEKTPSLKYNENHNFAYCFGGCSRAYDSIDIVRINQQMGFVEAVKYLNTI